MVPRSGIEPPTLRFSEAVLVNEFNDLASPHSAKLALYNSGLQNRSLLRRSCIAVHPRPLWPGKSRSPSQLPVRTSLLVRAVGFSPDISDSCPPSRVSPSVYWRANFEALGAFSAFSLRAPFRHLRNKMQQRASSSPNTDAFGWNPPTIGPDF